jgi:hypothetical protein
MHRLMVRFLPGMGRKAQMGQVKPYIVTLARRRAAAAVPLGRTQVRERGLASSEAFRRHLIDFVKQMDRQVELVQLGEATAFGIVCMVSTEDLADEIKQFPEVESVIEDTPSIAFSR